MKNYKGRPDQRGYISNRKSKKAAKLTESGEQKIQEAINGLSKYLITRDSEDAKRMSILLHGLTHDESIHFRIRIQCYPMALKGLNQLNEDIDFVIELINNEQKI